MTSVETPQEFQATNDDAGKRLDHFLVGNLPDVSRSRVQQLIAQDKVQVNGQPERASHKLRGGETIAVTGTVPLPPLRAVAEDIPLDIVYEDEDLAIVNKPARTVLRPRSEEAVHRARARLAKRTARHHPQHHQPRCHSANPHDATPLG